MKWVLIPTDRFNQSEVYLLWLIQSKGKKGKLKTKLSELAKLLDVSKPTISRHIRNLRDKGYIEVKYVKGDQSICLSIYKYEDLPDVSSLPVKKKTETLMVDHKETPGDSWYVKFAYRCWEIMIKNFPKNNTLRKAKLEGWADDVRKMVEIDNRDKKEMSAVIKFALQDTFWNQNILSMGNFREKYDKLYIRFEENKMVSKDGKKEQAVTRIRKNG